MQEQLLSIALKARADYELLARHLNPKRWSREFNIVFKFISDYYNRDKEALFVDRAVLAEIVAGSVDNEKHRDKFLAIIDEAVALDVSGANIKQAVLLGKREELAQALALAIANGKEHNDLLEEYRDILKKEDLEEGDSGIEVYTAEDIDILLAEDADGTGRIPIYPKALGERLGGGMRGSDSMVVFGRPEIAKTALILTIACGAARDGYEVDIYNNEERITRLYLRAISNITGLTSHEVREDWHRARDLAMDRGFGNLRFISMSPGSTDSIERELDKRPDTKLIIVDQLRNLYVSKSENRTNQLEAAQIGIRNIGKSRDVATVSVTQAGDSAQDKSILDMGDVDNSNTGIPGACDVLLGVGANEEQKLRGIRVLAPIKNKLGDGDHEAFPVRINPMISKYVSAEDLR